MITQQKSRMMFFVERIGAIFKNLRPEIGMLNWSKIIR